MGSFSAIFDVHASTPEQGHSVSKHRVLVPLSTWQLSDGLVDEMISIKKETDKFLDNRINLEFHLTGYLPDQKVQHLLTRLSDAGFLITSESRSIEEYARLFSSHDVVWLPNRYYILQSSGKAVDALVQGTPVIAPVGTYGWKEQNRWVEGAPGYSTSAEARDLFLNLPVFLPVISSELERQNKSIRDRYSPDRTIQDLVKAVGN